MMGSVLVSFLYGTRVSLSNRIIAENNINRRVILVGAKPRTSTLPTVIVLIASLGAERITIIQEMCIRIDIARGGFCSIELNRNSILTRLSLKSSGVLYVYNICAHVAVHIPQDTILCA